MCLYCNRGMGWEGLLQYDDVYQNARRGESAATYGFHESYDELREHLGSA